MAIDSAAPLVESTVSGAIWRLTQRRHCLSQPFQAETANSYHAYTVTGKVGSNGQLTPCIRTFKLMLFNDTFVIIAFVFSLTFHNVFMKHGIKHDNRTMGNITTMNMMTTTKSLTMSINILTIVFATATRAV